MNQFLLSADVAHLLKVTPATVRHWARKGDLEVAEETAGGVRLFRRSDVERLREARRPKSGRESREAA